MKQHHGWGLDELDNMIPFERQIYVQMLKDFIDRVNEENKKK